jgi:DNA-binding FrmR family transcriptional regulator
MCDETDPPPHKRTMTRLKRIAGQVEGVMRMVEEERYCIDVLTQIAAVQAALGKVGEEVLERHLQTCVLKAMESGETAERERVVAELMKLLTQSSSLLR